MTAPNAVGQVYLGLNHRYFTSADPTLVVGSFLAKRSRLPAWACLDCFPQWSDVHCMAQAEYEAEAAVWRACEAQEFEEAAALSHRHDQLEATHRTRYERLMRELVGQT